MVAGADKARYGLLLTVIYTLLAILAVILGRRTGKTRRNNTTDDAVDQAEVMTAP
jgi:hypothetical protein